MLYQHGIQCVGSQDSEGMMRTGWAIMELAGLDQFQAHDFIQDGYKLWLQSPAASDDVAIAFLEDLFYQLSGEDPPYPSDLYAHPPEQIQPAATFYRVRSWTGSELLAAAEHAGRTDLLDEYEPVVYDAITAAHVGFVPPRSLSWARIYASNHGLAEPWS